MLDLNGPMPFFENERTDAGANFGQSSRMAAARQTGVAISRLALEYSPMPGAYLNWCSSRGSYSSQANGRGTLTLLSSTGWLQMSIALNSGSGRDDPD